MAVSIFPAPSTDNNAPAGAVARTNLFSIYNGNAGSATISEPGSYAIRYTGPTAFAGISVGNDPRQAMVGTLEAGKWAYVRVADANQEVRVGRQFVDSSYYQTPGGTFSLQPLDQSPDYFTNSPFNNNNAIVFFPLVNLFILGSLTGGIATSPDGITWTTRVTNGSTSAINGFVFSANRVVAFGDSGLIRHSTDGVTWTTVSSPTGGGFRDGIFAGGFFTLVGDSGVSSRSTDGITWSTTTAPNSITMNSIAYYRGVWVANHRTVFNDGFRAYRSTDAGANWSIVIGPRITIEDTTNTQSISVAAGLDGFYLVNGLGIVYRSQNGSDWTNSVGVTNTASASWQDVKRLFGQFLFPAEGSRNFRILDPVYINAYTQINMRGNGGWAVGMRCDIAEGSASSGRGVIIVGSSNRVYVAFRKPIVGTVEIYRMVD